MEEDDGGGEAGEGGRPWCERRRRRERPVPGRHAGARRRRRPHLPQDPREPPASMPVSRYAANLQSLSLSLARARERASSLHGCGLSLCCIDQFFFRFGLVLFYSCFFFLSLLDLIFVFFGDALVLLCLAFTVSLVDVSVVLGGLFLRPCNVNSRTDFAPFLLKKVFFLSLFFDIISTLLSESPILSTVLWVAHMVVV